MSLKRLGSVPIKARLPCVKETQAWSLNKNCANMAEDELAAIRAKRLEELQTQYGVSSVQ